MLTTDELQKWRGWLERVKVRTECGDVPVLISRLDKLLSEAERHQLGLWEAA